MKMQCINRQEYENAALARNIEDMTKNATVHIPPDRVLSESQQIDFGRFLLKRRNQRINDILE